MFYDMFIDGQIKSPMEIHMPLVLVAASGLSGEMFSPGLEVSKHYRILYTTNIWFKYIHIYHIRTLYIIYTYNKQEII